VIDFLEQYWYGLVGLVIGAIAIRRIFRHVAAEEIDSANSTRSTNLRPSMFALLSGALVGAWAVPLLGEEALYMSVFFLVFISIVLGWIVMYTTTPDGVVEWLKTRGALGLWPRGMRRPVAESWALPAIFLAVGLIGGACLRILFEAWA
jgi:hypothetical protein